MASTPEMLPVLKKAGVVDAGGERASRDTLRYATRSRASICSPSSREEGAPGTPKQTEFQIDKHNLEEINFAYCTEFFCY